jgi:hypothetical protein
LHPAASATMAPKTKASACRRKHDITSGHRPLSLKLEGAVTPS